MANKGRISPDEQLLGEIFPNMKKKPLASKVLVQTFETCTFVAHVDDSEELLIRLESSGSRLPAVLALQRLAALVIPELVPKTLQTGKAKTKDGIELQYCVTEFLGNTVVLESVWDHLDDEQQLTIMDSVIRAMRKLQTLGLNDLSVRSILKEMEYVSKDAWLGGPHLGYFTDTASFLNGYLTAAHPKQPTATVEDDETGDGIIIKSTYQDLSSVHIPQEELESLKRQAVFCHNDLEPRNLLVRKYDSADGKLHYELAAIIDWELAGFYPLGYEYCLKDSLLGSSNLSYSWYALFKQRAVHQLELNRLPLCQLLLMQAVDIIHESRRRNMTRNFGVLARMKFIEREQLMRGPSIYHGWIRKPDAQDVRKHTSEDNKKLEEDVLSELGYINLIIST
jgi:hypothetical protein